MAIIGKVHTKVLKGTSNGKPTTWPSHSYNVIQIATVNGEKVYVTDKFYKPNVPLIIHGKLARKYVPNHANIKKR